MKVNCIIVEDEPKALLLLEEYVNKTPLLQLSAAFHTAMEAIEFLSKNEVDLIFLDINLQDLSGMDLAKVLAPQIKIIFTTAYSAYAVNSYEVNTIDYLLKPITYTRFFQAASKAAKLIEKEKLSDKTSSHIFLKSGKKMIQVNWDDIFFIEAMKEYISIITATQKIVIYKRMAEVEEIQPSYFKRVHNSFIVNLDKIEKVEDNLIHILQKEIPISKSYKDEFYASIKGRLM